MDKLAMLKYAEVSGVLQSLEDNGKVTLESDSDFRKVAQEVSEGLDEGYTVEDIVLGIEKKAAPATIGGIARGIGRHVREGMTGHNLRRARNMKHYPGDPRNLQTRRDLLRTGALQTGGVYGGAGTMAYTAAQNQSAPQAQAPAPQQLPRHQMGRAH